MGTAEILARPIVETTCASRDAARIEQALTMIESLEALSTLRDLVAVLDGDR